MNSFLAVTPPVLGLGGLWIALVVLIPIVLFGMVVYSVVSLRKPENWEQR
jgi:flagellar basal body-associated protein FliL